MAVAIVVLGSMTDDADAAGRMQLQTFWTLVDQDGTVEREKGVVTAKSRKMSGAPLAKLAGVTALRPVFVHTPIICA